MNFVFISPHFPTNYWNFVQRLHQNGVNVLGIGDCPYEQLRWELRDSLTEYYRVDNMENYDEMLRATTNIGWSRMLSFAPISILPPA